MYTFLDGFELHQNCAIAQLKFSQVSRGSSITSFLSFDNHRHVQPLTRFCNRFFRNANNFRFEPLMSFGIPRYNFIPPSFAIHVKVNTLARGFPICLKSFHDLITFTGRKLFYFLIKLLYKHIYT